MPFHVRDIRTQARIGEGAVLAHGLALKTGGAEVGERIGAGIVVVLVAPDEGAESEHGRVD